MAYVPPPFRYKWDLFHDHVVPGRGKLRDASHFEEDMSWRNLGKTSAPKPAAAVKEEEPLTEMLMLDNGGASEGAEEEGSGGADSSNEIRRRGRRRRRLVGKGGQEEEAEALRVMLEMLEHG